MAAETQAVGHRPTHLNRIIVAWVLTLIVLFAGAKLAAVFWFLRHQVDPFIDYSRWKTPFLVASDLAAASVIGVLCGTLSWLRHRRSSWAKALIVPLGALCVAVIVTMAVNLRVVEIYRAVLDRYLIHKVGDLSVMCDSITANIDVTFLLVLALGGLALWLVPRKLETTLGAATPNGVRLVALLLVVSLVPMFGAYRALRGRDTFGLKHNPIFALSLPGPGAFLHSDPTQVYARLSAKYPDGPELRGLGREILAAAPVPGHPELAGSAKGYNVVLVLLESVAARYVGPEITPVLATMMQHSVVYENHHTTAVNTFDAHYSLFRSMPVRGDAFDMRELHGGFARDTSMMEVFSKAGYSVGMFHGSFLHFIDTRWVWEAPGVDRLIDAQSVVSPEHPGWSWGADDADVADAALSWVREQQKKPFFLVFNPSGSHHPYFARPPEMYPGKTCLPRYKSAVHGVDAAIGRLLAGLDASGLSSHTIVAVVSDHGEEIKVETDTCGHGLGLVDDELNVPFFIHHPVVTATGSTEQLQTDHWDLAPTLAAMAGVSAPPEWLGRNLAASSVVPEPSFVSLDYRQHSAIVVGNWIGDLDVPDDRVAWAPLHPGQTQANEAGEPSDRGKAAYDGLLRSFDDRTNLHHTAIFAGRHKLSRM